MIQRQHELLVLYTQLRSAHGAKVSTCYKGGFTITQCDLHRTGTVKGPEVISVTQFVVHIAILER